MPKTTERKQMAMVGSTAGDRNTLSVRFDPRSNSIGFLRFAFAALVLIGHCWILGGFEIGAVGGVQTSTAALAVEGFFVLSGYLITKSFLSASSPVSYMWRRFLRIFPGYWVCLAIIALIFGPIALFLERGTLIGVDWVNGDQSPLGYLRTNAPLFIDPQVNIWNLFASTPLAATNTPISFDGSLWTLRYEFECYLLVAILGLAGVLRRWRFIVIVWAAFLWLGLVAGTLAPAWFDAHLPHGFGVRWLFYDLARVRFWLMFQLGALLFLYGRRVLIRPWLAAVLGGVFMVSIYQPGGGVSLGGAYNIIGRFAFAYLCLWLAITLPVRRFDSRGDFSYGVYIYAFPVQMLLVLLHANAWGWLPYMLLSFVGTLAFAVPSWFLIEAPAQRLKDFRLSGLQVPVVAAARTVVSRTCRRLSPSSAP